MAKQRSDVPSQAGAEGPSLASSLKPLIGRERVLALLRESIDGRIARLIPLRGGQLSRVFAFTAGGRDYVVRFAAADAPAVFEKEAFIARRLTPQVPIPAIVRLGRTPDAQFAVAEHAPGAPLNVLDPAASAAATPELITTLDAIHATDVRAWPGAGLFDGDGVGRYPSWRDDLASIREEEPGGFYGRWHALFVDSFLERALFDDVYARMVALLPRCPEGRSLIHGDFGFDNVLAERGRITAVLDWANARYGDFLFDVAWLHFFPSHENFAARFGEHYAATGRAIPDYEDRLRCYFCFIGLDSLRFYAKTGQRGHYDWARRRLLALVDAPPGSGFPIERPTSR